MWRGAREERLVRGLLGRRSRGVARASGDGLGGGLRLVEGLGGLALLHLSDQRGIALLAAVDDGVHDEQRKAVREIAERRVSVEDKR